MARKKLGALLEERGIITEFQLVAGLSHQRKWKVKIGKALMELGYLQEDVLYQVLADQLEMKLVKLSDMKIPGEFLKKFSKEQALKWLAIPVGEENGGLVVAVAEPDKENLKNALEQIAGMPVSLVLAKESEIEEIAYSLPEKVAVGTVKPLKKKFRRNQHGEIEMVDDSAPLIDDEDIYLGGESELKGKSSIEEREIELEKAPEEEPVELEEVEPEEIPLEGQEPAKEVPTVSRTALEEDKPLEIGLDSPSEEKELAIEVPPLPEIPPLEIGESETKQEELSIAQEKIEVEIKPPEEQPAQAGAELADEKVSEAEIWADEKIEQSVPEAGFASEERVGEEKIELQEEERKFEAESLSQSMEDFYPSQARFVELGEEKSEEAKEEEAEEGPKPEEEVVEIAISAKGSEGVEESKELGSEEIPGLTEIPSELIEPIEEETKPSAEEPEVQSMTSTELKEIPAVSEEVQVFSSTAESSKVTELLSLEERIERLEKEIQELKEEVLKLKSKM